MEEKYMSDRRRPRVVGKGHDITIDESPPPGPPEYMLVEAWPPDEHNQKTGGSRMPIIISSLALLVALLSITMNLGLINPPSRPTTIAATTTVSVPVLVSTTTLFSTTTVTLTGVFDFDVSVSPDSRTITAGQSATYTVTVTLTSGSTQSVSLSVSGLPEGTTERFSQKSGNPFFTSMLTITTSPTTKAGTYTLTITGTGGDKSKIASVKLIVSPPPPSPDLTVRDVVFFPQNVAQGGSLTVSWTEANIGGVNAGPYRVGVYLGISEYGRDYLLDSFNRDGLAAGGSMSSRQTFTIPSSVPPGSYYVTVFIDSQGDVSESNVGNNVGSSTPNRVTVTQQQQLQVDVWTNKGGQGRGNTNGGQYSIGESITLYCSVNINVDRHRVRLIRPDDVEVTALERGSSSAGTYPVSSTAGEPAGEWRVICEARSGGQSSSDEVRFTVLSSSGTTPSTVRVIKPNGGERLSHGQ
jgi:VCBS repeat-containing protein